MGARGFSYAVFGFRFSVSVRSLFDPREKPLDRSAVPLMPPSQ